MTVTLHNFHIQVVSFMNFQYKTANWCSITHLSVYFSKSVQNVEWAISISCKSECWEKLGKKSVISRQLLLWQLFQRGLHAIVRLPRKTTRHYVHECNLMSIWMRSLLLFVSLLIYPCFWFHGKMLKSKITNVCF